VTPAERRAALELEADRIKGRLDQLHASLAGDQDAWLSIQMRMPETVAEVVVDKLLGEARQQALALATIVKALDGTTASEAPAKPAADPSDEVRQARERKQREAAALAAQA
jgi:hypothetical protein